MVIVTFEQLEDELRQLSGWGHVDGSIQKHFQFESFMAGIEFVNSVAALSEQSNHHPDIDIRYTKIIITLSTHSEGGVTEKDLKLAKDIDKLV
jgi:4a-hydroxytetrahydrobiopterin dehydratase